jgi:AcrR family transcriptional regulator
VAVTRKSAADRREEILAAAAQVLLKKGILAATTRDVTDQLGVGAGLLNHYFTWAELRAMAFACVARADLERSLTSREGEPAKTVLQHLLASCYASEQASIWRVWIEATDLAVDDAALGEQVSVCAKQWQRALSDLLKRGVVEGAWRCKDPDGSAWRILAMITGLVSLTLAPHAPLSRAEATRHLHQAVEHETISRSSAQKAQRKSRSSAGV